ncbi:MULTISPECIES: DUF2062 domain-containing protein [Shewanella]|jgi:uncharacterized protein (DUF2062 family)|uniref:DUF2062 domain-containing protein n=1 Tax=Shewanella psychromarinicola TaxID=2487742 RepID=A0A3N4DF61_9GAMM|nr:MULTISPECIES: DUF2062 domain-containing protein [Shewanella]AZG35909.1 DUF2062 domain-containing protein [Shewanella psychromarinicola]MCL1084217.1 DUF2062 domain-containing protein [Shewanella psychromarinicola]PKG77210.1 DUF2062 domain-containing protein [Shewanella sp. Actino-trap-3]RPA22478.1 DUF2062 domain-containing protein [Shewanella psychromarinicola]|tara:strand:- start:12501 stop:13010 length:510 start_codon:yes stop_codon:yes gene_type:complete
MPKKLIQRFMPKAETLREHKYLRVFGKLLHKPNLWVLNRKSAPGAFAVGLFVAWLPLPFQMVVAAGFAILFNVNLPVAVALVWVTNPFTMPIMFYGAYLLGTRILGHKAQEFHFEATWAWIEASLSTIGPPFLIGSLALGIVSALIGYVVIKSMWRYSILFKWQKRKGQ